jgi:hypothetical protein
MIKDLSRFSKRFSFTLHTGEEIYPIKMTSRQTGKLAFRVSPGGKGGNTLEMTEQVDEEKMIRRVLAEGWGSLCFAQRISTRSVQARAPFSVSGQSPFGCSLLSGLQRMTPNPSIERTCPGKPGQASHVKR